MPLLRERVGRARWAAVLLGLCGVFVIVGPEVAAGSFGIGAVLGPGSEVRRLFWPSAKTLW